MEDLTPLPASNNLKTVALTGATGFLGSHLACLLAKQGYQVLCIKRDGSNMALFNSVCARKGMDIHPFSWLTVPLEDTEALANAFADVVAVFHCAGIIRFSRRDIDLLYNANVIGTRSVVNACLAAKNVPLIYASSVAAIGRQGETNVITENTPWTRSGFNSVYAISKHMAELEVWRGKEEGLPIAMVNPGVILGNGDSKSSGNQIIDHVRKGSWFYPIGRSGFVDVHDVAKAMLQLFEKTLYHKRYLMVAENILYKDLLDAYAKELKVKPPTIALKGLLLQSLIKISALAEFFHLPFPFPSSGLKSTSSNSEYISENIGDLTDFVFTPIQESIKNSLQE